MSRSQPLVARNGHTLRVLIVARISGCQNQKELSLEDQEDHAKQEVADRYDGPCEYTIIATKGKGERLDRPELVEVERLIRSAEFDLIIMEDAGRLIRGTVVVALWGLAVDRGTRCIAPNDGCDTADPTWEEALITACKDHVSHCAHTSRRIKQKQMNRFRRNGGATPLHTYGYIKPEGAKYYSEWRKDDDSIPHLQKALHILRREKNWTAVADYFNKHGVSTGPYCRNKRWDGAMVRRLFHNPLLKGRPQRGARCSDKNYECGRRMSKVNPAGPTYRDEPHLAHFDPDELDAVLAEVDEKHRRLGRRRPSQAAPIGHGKRARFPGQCAVCWYCGRDMVWGGNGIQKNLMCNGSRHYQCWNSVGFNGPLLTQKVLAAITTELWNLDGFNEQLAELVQLATEHQADDQTAWQQLEKAEAALEREKTNVRAVIRQNGPSSLLSEMLNELAQRDSELAQWRRVLQLQSREQPELPLTGAALRQAFEEASCGLAADSFGFSSLLRSLVSECYVYVVRSVDGGHFLPRVKVKLSLGSIVQGIDQAPAVKEFLTRVLTINLFEPPVRIQIREEVVKQFAERVKQRDIAANLGTHQATIQHALRLDRMMRERGLSSPYEIITVPPLETVYRKLKRSRNERYQFESREGYQSPAL
ncbi:recombinase family protein [Planctellipticum variicoloris]|uniref:recombinase family protein n=1 Tax=Planctellipticum variicoloris TaxID=3064265 RepID=UPI003013DA65|nr:recombinase family protein [Planctomycetaceae bacterium SH412]